MWATLMYRGKTLVRITLEHEFHIAISNAQFNNAASDKFRFEVKHVSKLTEEQFNLILRNNIICACGSKCYNK